MKRHIKIFCGNTIVVLLSIGWITTLAIGAVPATRPGNTNAIHSVFTLPANPQEGRDPFFPDSTRPYEVAAPPPSPQVTDITSLVIKGFSGTMNHRLVIINNHTFAAGDEGDVITPAGRIHLLCVEIRTNSAVIEVGNQRHELFYSNKL